MKCGKPASSASSSARVTASASWEIGTQQSVVTARHPGRICSPERKAWWRAVHSRVRSSGVVAHWKAVPPWAAASSCTIAACSATPAALPWNSISSMGFSARPSLSCALTATTAFRSSSSQRAIGTPTWMISIVVSTADFASSNETIAAATLSGRGCSFSVISVITPNVPSLPTIRRVRS